MKEEDNNLFSITARSPKQLGHALKRHRIKLKLTQIEVSQRSGVRQANISQLEQGHVGVKLETLFKVITALNLETTVRRRKSTRSKEIRDA
ncbi:MAG: helix-turn-helix domain-containing protein [Bacteriovoracaceae bacterium]|nr:helix-turn-helix domain-containing protein [Bacteriovoracaceae bacterium]